MQEMIPCGSCGGWVYADGSVNQCTCQPQTRFVRTSGDVDAIPDDGRRYAIKQEYGQRAQQVDPYKPNRKQLRAQKAAKRKQKTKSRRK